MVESSITQQILKRLSLGPQPRLVLFDIDSTLVCTSPRTQQILREFASDQKMKNKFGAFLKPIENVISLPKDWGIREPLSRVITDFSSVDKEAFIEEVREFWKVRFFSNEYLNYDTAYSGAVNFVNQVKQTGSEIMYLTARDEPRMGPGTRLQLANLGFPADPKNVVLKPVTDMEDTDFKANFFMQMQGPWSLIYYFENEPMIIQEVEKVRTDINIVWMNSVHSNRAEEPHHLPQLKMGF